MMLILFFFSCRSRPTSWTRDWSSDVCSSDLSDFRKEQLEAREALFVDVLRLCGEAGLVKLGRVALDGRKVAASAALDQNRKREGLEREIRRIFEEAERLDAEEDAAHGADRRGDELPRSEEHTSELQSRGHLVCRLLLEKKKTTKPSSI